MVTYSVASKAVAHTFFFIIDEKILIVFFIFLKIFVADSI